MQITTKLKTTTKIKERQAICRHNRHSDLSIQISCTDGTRNKYSSGHILCTERKHKTIKAPAIVICHN